jgi:hypothetical protein
MQPIPIDISRITHTIIRLSAHQFSIRTLFTFKQLQCAPQIPFGNHNRSLDTTPRSGNIKAHSVIPARHISNAEALTEIVNHDSAIRITMNRHANTGSVASRLSPAFA